MTFQQWMRKVDAIIDAITGMSADDLPDYCYADAFEDGVKPATAARRAIGAAQEY